MGKIVFQAFCVNQHILNELITIHIIRDIDTFLAYLDPLPKVSFGYTGTAPPAPPSAPPKFQTGEMLNQLQTSIFAICHKEYLKSINCVLILTYNFCTIAIFLSLC